MEKHYNNFHFLRFLFAVFVVISHAYPLSGGSEKSQWIYEITNGQIVLARIGLDGFFIISGFFIFQSLSRSNTILNYYKKRFLRLFPALFVVLLLTLLLLVPFVYEGQVPLLRNKDIYTYLPNNISLYKFQAVIKGVFDHNAYHSINGSLWTIRYEFSLYVALSFLYIFRKNKKIVKGLIIICFTILLITFNFFIKRFSGSSILGMNGYEILDLGTFFVGGSLLAAFNFHKFKNKLLLPIVLLALVFSIYFNFYSLVKHIFLPIAIILTGYIKIPLLVNFNKIGDMSYGIYIYSFPIQQILVYYFKLSVYQLMFYSLIISIIFGYLSWHLIEKRALAYKNKSILELKNSSFLKRHK